METSRASLSPGMKYKTGVGGMKLNGGTGIATANKP